MSRLKKGILITIGIIVLLIVLVIVFISPITKHLIEKYDKKYSGREITMDLAYVNPFTGYIHFRNLNIFEYESDSIFFATKGFSVNLSVLKILKNNYEISKVTLTEPWIIISQTKDKSNLDDLIEKFTVTADTTTPPAKYHVKQINIEDGEFHYRDNVIPVNYFVKKFNLEIKDISSEVDSLSGKFDFVSGVGSGNMGGNFMVNMNVKRYRLDVKIEKFDLNIIEQYLNDLTNYGTFHAMLDADLQTSGSYEDPEDVTIAGMMAINDFHFGKTLNEDYASFDQLIVSMTEISPKKYIFHGDSLILRHPFFKFEQYDHLDNLQTMFGTNGSNLQEAQANSDQFNLILEIADFIDQISDYFFQSHYKINRFAVYDADLRYNDYSLSEKFSIDMNPLIVEADSIDKNKGWMHLRVRSGIKPYGNFSAKIAVNPKDSSDFDLQYDVNNLPLTMFNPYVITYSSYPFDRGTVELKGDWRVRNGEIGSRNNLLILDPRLTQRLKNKEIKFLPLRFVMALVREQGNVIDYEIPIKGNLNDPKFKIKDIIIDVLENIFVKPVRTNYRMQVKNVEKEIEKSLSIKWDMRRAILDKDQEKFLEKIAGFLKENPDASISVHPQLYESKEKEYILFFEAKKKFYLDINNMKLADFSEGDSANVQKMSVKDSTFVKYIHRHIKDSLVFTIQEKCERFIGTTVVNRNFNQLHEKRVEVFTSYFKEGDTKNRVKFLPVKDIVPFNGFSFFKIEYEGELPASLIKAYAKMEDLNKEKPREQFLKERKDEPDGPAINPNIKTN
ncbi:MAG: DUF748 domain-containing protein [Bacteroidota bacterium]|nr:DUF748 domain-containing protein [Bacteroidota bacterium]